jgi:hypothetical protein
MAHQSQAATRPDANPPPGFAKVKTVVCLGGVGVLGCHGQYDHPDRDSVDGQPVAGMAVTDARADSVQKGSRV